MGRLLTGLLVLLGLVALIGVGGYFALKRPDIAYETLAARYENSASRYIDLPSGVRVHYRDEGQAAPAPTLVLLHGFSASLHTWEGWVAELGDDYRIVSLDLPGHGLTRAPAGYEASIENFRDLVEEFAAAQGLQRFAIAGNSMGGNVAWEYALAHPERLDALILVDSSGWPGHDGEREPLIFKLMRNPAAVAILRDLDNTRLIRQGLESSFADPTLVTDDMAARYADLSRAPGHREILLRLAADRMSRNVATAEQLTAIAAPVLILHGDQDNLIPPGHATQFRDAIAGAELVTFANAGHIPQEEIPVESAQATHDFLYRVHEGAAIAAE